MEEELIEAELINGEWKPKGVKEKYNIGRNKIIEKGKTVRIDLKLIEYQNKIMFKVRKY